MSLLEWIAVFALIALGLVAGLEAQKRWGWADKLPWNRGK